VGMACQVSPVEVIVVVDSPRRRLDWRLAVLAESSGFAPSTLNYAHL